MKEVKDNSKRENDITENINDFVICISNLHFVINEVDKGIRYFQKNYIQRFKEIKEYILLGLLEDQKLVDAWIKEYESHNINYRDSLKEQYSEFKKILK